MGTNVKTSSSDPIRIDFIDGKAVGLEISGRIGLTIAPGKKDRPRGWDRDLDVDLSRMRAEFNAHVLASLMETHEYELLHIADLPSRATAAGLDVRWFPIVDVDVPDSARIAEFAKFVDGLVEATRSGNTVVIHCRGGLGRSGTVAACCLVQLGLSSDEAIRATRAARSGAIETKAQAAWVGRFATHLKEAGRAVQRRTGVARSEMKLAPSERVVSAPRLNAFRGCLLGGAIGDALGYPIEFIKADQIQRQHGARAPEILNFDRAEVARISDDTQMTLFTAEGLLRAKQRMRGKGICHPPTIMAFALLRWYETQGGDARRNISDHGWLIAERALHSQRAPGNTCMSALKALAGQPSMSVPTIENPPNNSKGCGAVMRVAPCGLAGHSREAAFELARDNGVITHGHPSGYLSGAYFAALIWDLARGASIEAAMVHADTLLANEKGCGELQRILERCRELARRGQPNVATIESLGGGWTGEEALAIALLCAQTFDPNEPSGFQETLWRAAAHSGDSDSTAAITGNLLGAMLGLGALAPSWLKILELRDVIDRLASDLYSSMIQNEELPEYPPN